MSCVVLILVAMSSPVKKKLPLQVSVASAVHCSKVLLCYFVLLRLVPGQSANSQLLKRITFSMGLLFAGDVLTCHRQKEQVYIIKLMVARFHLAHRLC